VKTIRTLLTWLCIAALLAACRIGAPASQEPVTVTIKSPGNNAMVPVGVPVQVAVEAVAQAGITRVELSVNGTLVAVSNNTDGSSPYQATIGYTPLNAGPLNVIVRAYDKSGVASTPVGLALQAVTEGAAVTATLAPGATAPPASTPLPQVTPTTVPGVPGPGGCVLNAQFIADITVPDGTTVALGGAFVKTWRVRNTGTCGWDNRYKLIFAAGNQLNAPGAVALPATDAGAVTDVSVNMQAPATGSGPLAGEWRFASPDNTVFGNKLTVVIALPAPTATTAPTLPPPTATATPSITFNADPTSVAKGTCAKLRWSTANVSSVFLDGTGMPSPSEKEVCPTETTTYTLKVNFNDGSSTTKYVIIMVTAGTLLYSFADNAPSARWYNEVPETLSYGGSDTDTRGFVISRDGTALEDNSLQLKVIETHPRWVSGGVITGEYDVTATLQTGDKFRTGVGFLKNAISGTVKLRVFFKDALIGEIGKSYTGALGAWVIDLSPYAGQSGKFRIQAFGDPSTTQAWICWINPRIER
jgi:hypothetical protein